MADKKITQLTNITGADLASADEFVVVDITADETKAITFDELKTAFDTGTGFVRVTGDTMTGALNVESTITADGLTVDGDATVAGTIGVTVDSGTIQTGKDSALSRSHLVMNNPNGVVAKWDTNGTDLLHYVTDEYKLYTAGNKAFEVDGNGDISFYEDTGTTAKFFWDSSAESLGIGTSSPNRVLDIATTTGGTIIHLTDDSTGHTATDGVDLQQEGTLFQILNREAGDIRFGTDNTERMRIDSSGRVGIGVTPTRQFHIHDASGDNNLHITNSTSGTTGTDGFSIVSQSSTNDVLFNQRESANIRIYTSGSERMRIDASGNVGIGNSSPAGALHVSRSGLEAGITLERTTSATAKFTMAANDGKLVFTDQNQSETRMVINSSGNVGIGTSSPVRDIQIGDNTGSAAVVSLQTTTGGNGSIYFGDNTATSAEYAGMLRYSHSDNAMQFWTSSEERMRIDSSGNLLVGKTSADFGSSVGFEANANDTVYVTRSGGASLTLNRTSSDGDIALFRKNGTTVGSIAANGGSIIVGSGDTGLYFDAASDRLIPVNPATASGRDNAVNLGGGSERFKDLYLSGGVYLGGTGSANKLDDYEEGLYTVSVQTGSGSISLNSTNNKYSYVKVGKLVTVTGRIDVSSVSSPSGPLYLNLPFTASTGVKYESAISLFIWNSTSSAPETGLWVGWVTNGASQIQIRYGNSNTPSANVANYIQANTEFRISVSYETDA